MSTKAQVKTQAKTPAAPVAAHIPHPPVAEPEHEAERPDIAAQLEGAARLGHSLRAVGVDSPAPPIIQRQEIPEGEKEEEEALQMKREPATVQRQELPVGSEEELQTKPANDVQRQGNGEGFQLDDETAGRIHRARGGGQPLEEAVQEQMSASLGHDFSGVRVHTDAEADELSQQIQAKAFTTGPDIFFKRGAYDPGSPTGRELVAHELSHVVQQSAGRVRGDQRGMVVLPSGDAFEQEAEHAGTQGGDIWRKATAGEARRAGADGAVMGGAEQIGGALRTARLLGARVIQRWRITRAVAAANTMAGAGGMQCVRYAGMVLALMEKSEHRRVDLRQVALEAGAWANSVFDAHRDEMERVRGRAEYLPASGDLVVVFRQMGLGYRFSHVMVSVVSGGTLVVGANTPLDLGPPGTGMQYDVRPYLDILQWGRDGGMEVRVWRKADALRSLGVEMEIRRWQEEGGRRTGRRPRQRLKMSKEG